jgi:hypothetical protein
VRIAFAEGRALRPLDSSHSIRPLGATPDRGGIIVRTFDADAIVLPRRVHAALNSCGDCGPMLVDQWFRMSSSTE